MASPSFSKAFSMRDGWQQTVLVQPLAADQAEIVIITSPHLDADGEEAPSPAYKRSSPDLISDTAIHKVPPSVKHLRYMFPLFPAQTHLVERHLNPFLDSIVECPLVRVEFARDHLDCSLGQNEDRLAIWHHKCGVSVHFGLVSDGCRHLPTVISLVLRSMIALRMA